MLLNYVWYIHFVFCSTCNERLQKKGKEQNEFGPCVVSCCVVTLKAHDPRRYVKRRSDDNIRVVSDVHV